MANTKSAGKRARQATARSLRNRRVLTLLRTLKKRSVSTGAGETDVRAMISALDKAAKRGIIHKNAADRRKARLKKSLAAAPTAAAPVAAA
jgi:small subunit ribosomal protein S20